MPTYLALDDAEAANVLFGMYESEWYELAAGMMGIPVRGIANVTVFVENGQHFLVVTEN